MGGLSGFTKWRSKPEDIWNMETNIQEKIQTCHVVALDRSAESNLNLSLFTDSRLITFVWVFFFNRWAHNFPVLEQHQTLTFPVLWVFKNCITRPWAYPPTTSLSKSFSRFTQTTSVLLNDWWLDGRVIKLIYRSFSVSRHACPSSGVLQSVQLAVAHAHGFFSTFPKVLRKCSWLWCKLEILRHKCQGLFTQGSKRHRGS